ncbi:MULTISPECIES: Lrp/AsnC ligand binding domain-containing protein [Actinomadura]|uniref:Lrp/AsnC ligand binding domain-containing protein n=1 Tax=Actinomadura yumaensis TaxID=111807 RepID=A0ABW2CNA6_9ACTN|nr:Lrp/AsnC ligand binding domain-containing protein [Actinomadura sp. J1-007]MWK37897.1 AsnC family transcriptional regulator [Actinomadura sp. J1-007]
MHADARLLIRSRGDPAETAAALTARPTVYGCQVTTGEQDLVVRVRVRDDTASAAEADHIGDLDTVEAVRVFRVVSTVLDLPTPAVLPAPPRLDAIDWRLLELPQHDGRVAFSRLSSLIGLSTAATRARVVGLRKAGVVQVVAVADPARIGLAAAAGFALTTAGGANRVAAAAAQMPEVRAVAGGWGPWDIIGEVAAATPTLLAARLAQICALPGVTAHTTWSIPHPAAAPAPIDVRPGRPTLATVLDELQQADQGTRRAQQG